MRPYAYLKPQFPDHQRYLDHLHASCCIRDMQGPHRQPHNGRVASFLNRAVFHTPWLEDTRIHELVTAALDTLRHSRAYNHRYTKLHFIVRYEEDRAADAA